MKYSTSLMELQNCFINNLVNIGFEQFDRVSLLSEAFPTNFTPSGGEEHLNRILQEPNPKKSFCTIQPCFRYQDIENIHTGFHMPLFEMGVSISVNEFTLEDQIKQFFVLFDSFKLERKKIRVSIFKGDNVLGVDLPLDTESMRIWKTFGVGEEQFVYLGAEENYFLLRNQGYAGIKTEVFYDNNGDSIEIAVFVKITHNIISLFDKKYSLRSIENSVVCWGIGSERWCALINDKNSITSIVEYTKLIEWSTNSDKLNQDRLNLSLVLNSFAWLIADGVEFKSLRGGRRRLFKKIVAKLNTLINLCAIDINSVDFFELYNTKPISSIDPMSLNSREEILLQVKYELMGGLNAFKGSMEVTNFKE